MMGPALITGSPQTELAPALLRVGQEVVLPSEEYVERLKRHYALFRGAIDGKPEKRWGKNRNRRPRGLR
jgi:hypothetical protein